MKYHSLGDYIREVNVRNRELKVTRLLGLSIEKRFIPSIANTIGTDMAGYNVLWTLPKNGMGVVNSTTMSTPCLAVPGSRANEMELYMYVPGNGLAKYTIAVTMAGDVNGDGECTGSDVTALYNYILFNDASAIVNGDQNGDGDITGSDVTAVYNIILDIE